MVEQWNSRTEMVEEWYWNSGREMVKQCNSDGGTVEK